MVPGAEAGERYDISLPEAGEGCPIARAGSPCTGAKWQISAAGGTAPQWRRDGRELFYVSPDTRLMAVPMKLGSSVEPGTPQVLFAAPGGTGYAPSRDGQRFLVNLPAGGEGATAPPLTVVTDWQSSLRK